MPESLLDQIRQKLADLAEAEALVLKLRAEINDARGLLLIKPPAVDFAKKPCWHQHGNGRGRPPRSRPADACK